MAKRRSSKVAIASGKTSAATPSNATAVNLKIVMTDADKDAFKAAFRQPATRDNVRAKALELFNASFK